MRQIALTMWLCAFLTGCSLAGLVYEHRTNMLLEARIDQLEEDVGDACVQYDPEPEDEEI